MPFHKLINTYAASNKPDFTKYKSLKCKFSLHECKIIIMNSVIHNDSDNFLLRLSWNRPGLLIHPKEKNSESENLLGIW
jgi:hypothetical protein